MPKIKKIFFLIVIIFSICVITSCHNNVNKDDNTILTISATKNQKEMIEALVNDFNKNNENYTVVFEEIENEKIKNYMLKHNALKGDIIIFDNFNDANYYGDYLSTLAYNNVVSKYQSSIINYLKDSNNNLYVLPSIGRFYGNFYNEELLNKYSYSVPTNLNELFKLATRLETKIDSKIVKKGSSSVGGKESVINAFMQVSYPNFFSTPIGNSFLENYINCDVSILDSTYQESFINIFNDLKKLYFLNYFSLDDIDNDISNGINEFIDNQSFVLQSSIKESYINIIENMNNVSMYPFVGLSSDESFLPSKPLFYLGVSNNISEDKYKICESFVDFFSSEEGQSLLKNKNSEDSRYISYLKNVYIDLNSNYKNMLKPINEGRVFLVDTFIQVFENNVDDIISFLNNKISISELLLLIDNNIAKLVDEKNSPNKISIIDEIDFDVEALKTKENKANNYVADSLRKYTNVNGVILDNDIFSAPIYQDGFNYEDINLILNNKNLYYVKVSVSQLKILLNYFISINELPLISGIRLKRVDGEIKIYNLSNVLLDNDYNMTVLLDDKMLSLLGVNNNLKKNNLVEIFKKLLKDKDSISAGFIDNRYGNILEV